MKSQGNCVAFKSNMHSYTSTCYKYSYKRAVNKKKVDKSGDIDIRSERSQETTYIKRLVLLSLFLFTSQWLPIRSYLALVTAVVTYWLTSSSYLLVISLLFILLII